MATRAPLEHHSVRRARCRRASIGPMSDPPMSVRARMAEKDKYRLVAFGALRVGQHGLSTELADGTN